MKTILPIIMAIFVLHIAPLAYGAQNRSGTVTLTVDLSNQPIGKETKLWVPYPVTDSRQVIGDISVKGDFATSGIYTDRENGTPILYAHWPKDAASRTLVFSFTVDRQEIRQTDLPTIEPAWNPSDYEHYLTSTSLGPVDGEVKKLADSIVVGKTTVLEKARALYDWTVENMYRDPDTIGCGTGDVCLLLKRPGGKCTDISSVYIALCRAAGIPARELFSVRLGKKTEQDITTWQHCWAEFFLPGYGWVTVDPADVRKAMLVEKLELDSEKTAAYREFFWGGADPYRVVIAQGRDVVLNPRQAGPPLNTFGYPYAEVGGEPIDFYDPKGFVYTYSFKEL
ncbi:transglutaminase-like domain-containing protein [Desulfofustis glycolicus]|uniref:Transglutaminase-like enzyme, putative cysteine protease n=1 Tax=Desulfofustis glycolicus DSM 9705 TaxID=1121409 RepID=A0A1M5SZX2_9BACT|nr:transglutaminase domain-containing protein [Desulfofustis glycolicus]MCB2215273.1 transglutaminase domain-containing protein [Desulfobulbaceae bacterium]SHH43683.1 Transglutaminase-like enzyme, putative cysteine protease [Desulfofustis glycolicus DSM 9705]